MAKKQIKTQEEDKMISSVEEKKEKKQVKSTTKKTVEKEPTKNSKKNEIIEEKLAEIEKNDEEEVNDIQAVKGGSYIPAIGRRKTSIARVRLIKNGKGEIVINGKKMEDFFTTFDLRDQVKAPLRIAGQEDAVDVSVKVTGGGIRGQAEAVRHGLSRALVQLNPTFRKSLKKLGYLKRDARKRERKKFGLKGARRAPQWSKR